MFTTNRISSANLKEAIAHLKQGGIGTKPNGQVNTLLTAMNLKGDNLIDFIGRLEIEDQTGNLQHLKNSFEARVIDWKPGADPSSQLRGLEALVQHKATSAGSKNNIIKRADLLNALGVLDPRDLLPCAPYLEKLDDVIDRPEKQNIFTLFSQSKLPVIVHAEGGVGKTIFMQSLEQEFARQNSTVFLDCFAGGNYRIIGQNRHAPRIAGMHIINSLAFKGLCEPVLPTPSDGETYIKTFRRRLESISTLLLQRRPDSNLYIFIDAADNAAQQAEFKNEDCFPKILIESLSHTPIDRVKLVVSCRTHRREITYGNAKVVEQALNPFSKAMSTELIKTKFPKATAIQTSLAYSRSNGNGRVLAYLCEQWENEIENSRNTNQITVEDLIAKRVEIGQQTLIEKGAKQDDIDVLFAALARLPLPLPVDQLANAIAMSESEVQSYCNDLVPLLEQTPEGIIFRDEPTDTWFRENCENTSEYVNALISRLHSRQVQSSYAAFALPEILLEARKTDEAIAIVENEQYPSEMKASSAKRYLSEIRTQSALKLSALDNNTGACIQLLAKLAMLSTANDRCDSYVSDNVALVGGLQDYENAKRLFEDYSGWNGARSARFCIYYIFIGAMDEAAAHLKALNDWMGWHFDQDDEERSSLPEPDPSELSAIPLFYCLSGDFEKSVKWICGATPASFRFNISKSIAAYLRIYDDLNKTNFVEKLLNSSLSMSETSAEGEPLIKELILALLDELHANSFILRKTLFRLNKGFATFRAPRSDNLMGKSTNLQKSLLGAAFSAVKLNKAAARTLLKAANLKPRSDYDFISHPSTRGFVPTLYAGIIMAFVEKKTLSRRHFLPDAYKRRQGAWALSSRSDVEAFVKDKATKARPVRLQHGSKKKIDNSISDEDAGKFASTVEIIFEAAQFVFQSLQASENYTLSSFSVMLNKWNRETPFGYYGHRGFEFSRLKFNIFEECVLQCFQRLSEKDKPKAAHDITELFLDNEKQPETHIKFIELFAKFCECEKYAGKLAVRFSKKIDDLETVEDRGTFSVLLTKATIGIDQKSSKMFFLNGLEKLDGVGTEDYDIVSGILQLVAAQQGDEIPIEHAQRLMNLCENIMCEPHKFWWPLYCSAATQSFPWAGLARSQRWDFRDIIDLEYVNGIFAQKLTEAGKLDPKRACILYGLDTAINYHSEFGPTRFDVMDTIIKKADTSDRSKIASFLVGITRLDQKIDEHSEQWKEICKRYGKLLIGHEIPLSPQIQTNSLNDNQLGFEIKNLHEPSSRDSIDHTFGHKIRPAVNTIAKTINPMDTFAIDQALEKLSEKELVGRPDICLIEILRDKVLFSKRADFLDTIQELTQLDFHARIYSFKETCNAWAESSAFINNNRKKYVSSLLEICLPELFDRDGSFGYRLGELAEISGQDKSELALEALKFSARQNIYVSGSDAFSLAMLLMKHADAISGHNAVMGILSNKALKIDSEKSEGLPPELLETPKSQVEALSKLLWARLGHDNKLMKWRAIHCVVATCQFGLVEDIEEIIKLYETNPQTCFHVPDQKYCVWTAREAFLIALRRAALVVPNTIQPLNKWLRTLAFDNTDHVLISRLAADTLTIIERNKENPDLPFLEKLTKVGKTLLNYRERDESDFVWGEEDADIDFYFEYDFNKYEPLKFGRLFGFAKPDAQKAIVSKVTDIDPETERMSDSGGRYRHDSYNGRVDTNKFEYYGEQLVRHAMILAGSELIKSHPIIKPITQDYCLWDEWLNEFQTTFSDGYLLSDGTDIPPDEVAISVIKGERNGQYIEVTDSIIDSIFHKGNKSSFLPIAGSWQSADGCTVSLMSCLIDSYGAIGKCIKHSKREWFDAALPFYDIYNTESERMMSGFEKRAKLFQPWIVLPERKTGIDKWDGFACAKAIERYEPSEFLVDALQLTPSCRFKMHWRNNKYQDVLQSEAWGCDSNRLSFDEDQGKRLLFRKKEFSKFLTENKKQVVFVLRVERYGSSESWKEEKTLREGRIILMDELYKLRSWKIKKPKKSRW